MIESRCGIKCSVCEYKEKMNCKGCVSIANPFWGECPVKGCCESNAIENCGFCDNFSCDQLNQFAYDKEQGDDGARLKQCECWCKAVK